MEKLCLACNQPIEENAVFCSKYGTNQKEVLENINTDTWRKPMIRAFIGLYKGAWCLVGAWIYLTKLNEIIQNGFE